MSPSTIRKCLRWSHISVGGVIVAYVFSPLHSDPLATLVARLSLLPVVILTGLALWQQGRFTRWIAVPRRLEGDRI